MVEENQVQVSQEEKDLYRRLFGKLQVFPTQYLALLMKLMTVLSIKGDAFAQLLDKVIAEAMTPKASVPTATEVDIEGQYEIPALPGGVVDLGRLPGVNPDPDYVGWGLHEDVSERSEITHVLISKAEDNAALSRLISPSGPVEICLTQAQVDYLVRHLREKLNKITKAGVFFFFRVTQDDGLTYELYSFKIIGYGRNQLRFAVRKATNPGNSGVPLKGAYIVRPI